MQNPQGYGNPYGTPSGGGSSTGLQPNIASVLAYFFGGLGGLIFFLIEKENKLVRFHAMQSIIFNVAIVAIVIVYIVFSVILSQISFALVTLFGLFIFILWIAIFAGWVFLMVKAYQNQMFKLPILGNIAESITSK
jgi:uncharacterized membrane protein